jgi:hypothetical protein
MNRFRLTCYLRLKRELGQIDACVECLEIAVREFLRQCDISERPSRTVQDLSRKHGIRVDAVDVARFRCQSVGLQLIGVTQVFETFLDSFLREHPRLGSRDGRKDSETVLDFVIRRLEPASMKRQQLKDSLDYRLYDYYRLLRNDLAHSGVGLEEVGHSGSRGKLLDGLRTECAGCDEYRALKAPNPPASVSFDDYVLFTRVAKRLARALCVLGQLSDEEILDWLRRNRTRQGTANRQRNAMTTLLRITFGTTPSEATPFVDRITAEEQ